MGIIISHVYLVVCISRLKCLTRNAKTGKVHKEFQEIAFIFQCDNDSPHFLCVNTSPSLVSFIKIVTSMVSFISSCAPSFYKKEKQKQNCEGIN